ncbi:MAG: chemotaxis response regulator protein-glutamate methylesterase [Elusimicrobia bacterium]|nr:chemotaxis response regulator protein-glutamate methylesterase [Elusimicrobiota bacterium]
MIRVLVVDDSALVRQVLAAELSRHEDIEVVGTAADPFAARDKIVRLKPDVVTLDLEMPRMDGLSFLARLMRHHPMPVVVLSSLAPAQSETAIRALELGAVEVLAKPSRYASSEEVNRALVLAVRAAASSRPRALAAEPAAPSEPRAAAPGGMLTTHRVLALGASTGGTIALEALLRRLPADLAGTVVTQHMPPGFTASFAQRLDSLCAMDVREAKDGDRLVPGLVLIAPGGMHMLLGRSGAQYHVRVKDGPPVHHQRPSVDVLFQSVARAAGRNAVAALMTGMGADGAAGLLDIQRAGGRTLAQDEESCVVFGMPKEAIRLGAADRVVGLGGLHEAILSDLNREPKAVKELS